MEEKTTKPTATQVVKEVRIKPAGTSLDGSCPRYFFCQ